MKTKHYRTLVFVYGLVAGLVLGLVAGFLLRTFLNIPAPEFTIVSKSQESIAENKPSKQKIDKSKVLEESTTDIDSLTTDSVSVGDEFPASDSIMNGGNDRNGDEIVVATDELIFTRIIPVIGDTSSLVKHGKNLDSLLIDDRGNYPAPIKYKVEFWKSPINYKGYRLQKDRLVVYGIVDFEDAILRRNDGKLYLLVGAKAYVLEESLEYRPLISSKPPTFHN